MGLERLLTPWPERRILCDDERLLVVDKLPGVPVHGGDERLGDDVVGRLKARDREGGGERYLGLHQRLDKDVSGLLFMNRDPADNHGLAEEARERRIERRYLAVVSARPGAGVGLRARGTLTDQLLPVKGEATRVVARGGQRAVTHFEVQECVGPRALVSITLETGRKHQIRAQLAHAGYPVAGDRLYGGEPAPRLMLHCTGLSLPCLQRDFGCAPPAAFDGWLARGALELPLDPRPLIEDAGSLRWSLREATDAFRLVNDAADLLPGVCVEAFGDHAVLFVSTEQALARRRALAEALVGAGARGVYLKTRVRADLRRRTREELAPRAPLAGEPAPEALEVSERGQRSRVELAGGLSTGLFLDQRDNRARVRARSGGKRVLNLFAYTCSFSVAAALGGASEVTSVDLSKRALERGRQNFLLNGLDPRQHRFVADDALKWLSRAARRALRFDLVVLDPPSFSSQGKATFSVGSGYQELVRRVFGVLAPGGLLLAVTNHRKTSPAQLRAMLRRAADAAARPVLSLKLQKLPLDFSEGSLGAESAKSFWLEVE